MPKKTPEPEQAPKADNDAKINLPAAFLTPHEFQANDGRTFEKLFLDQPFIPKGEEGAFNASESGHPYAFADEDGRVWLFYQGSPDRGKTWYLSRLEIGFREGKPYVIG